MYMRLTVIAIFICGSSAPIFASNPKQTNNIASQEDVVSPVNEQEISHRGPIYGSHLMTLEEHHLYGTHLNGLKTQNEQEQFLREHRKTINERAEAQKTFLDNVAPRGLNKRIDSNNPASIDILYSDGW